MHSTLWVHAVHIGRSGKAECHHWASVLPGSHKVKNEVAEHWVCLHSEQNCKSPVTARSEFESTENGISTRISCCLKSNMKPLDFITK